MSDGTGNPGKISEAVKAVGDAVVEPAKDEIGAMIEAGIQSITGASDDPQKQALKQQKQQQNLAEAQRKIQWWKQIEAQQAAVRAQKQQENVQKQQEVQQQEQVKQFEVQKKEVSKNQALVNAQNSRETKGGQGAGG